jgi:hypothetical protein
VEHVSSKAFAAGKLHLLPLCLLLALFIPLMAAEALIILPFELVDEDTLFGAARYTAEFRHLPPPVSDDTYGYRHQSGQPPLFYLIGALVIAPFDTSDFGNGPVLTPASQMGLHFDPAHFPYGANFYDHPASHFPPYAGSAQALIAVRLFNGLVSGVTLVLIYLTVWQAVQKVWHSGRPHVDSIGVWLAAGLTGWIGFSVRYVGLAASARNDNLANLFAAAAIYVAVRTYLSEQGQPNWRQAALMGALVGLSMLAKLTAAPAAAVLTVLVAVETWQAEGGSRRERLVMTVASLAAYVAAAGLVFGWWPVRNMVLYSDPFMLRPHQQFVFSARVDDPFAVGLVPIIYKLGLTAWGEVMWSSLQLPLWANLGYFALVAAGLAGVVWSMRRGRKAATKGAHRRLAMWMIGLCGAAFAVALVWMKSGGIDSRFALPALPAFLVLLALGLAELVGLSRARWVAVSAGLASYGLAWGFLLLTLVPANRVPLIRAFPASMQPLGWEAGGVRLAGYEVRAERPLQPGDTLAVHLYWEALRDLDSYYVVVAQAGALSNPETVIAQVDQLAGGSIYPTAVWRAGDRIDQEVRLRLADEVEMPGLYYVRVALRPYDALGDTPRLDLTGPDGTISTLITLETPLVVLTPVGRTTHTTDVRFGDALILRGWDVVPQGNSLRVDLVWQARGPASPNLTVFVHVLGTDGSRLAQHDSIPANGNFPAWAWQDDLFVDSHWLDLPSLEGARLMIGVYDWTTGERLPVAGSPDGALELTP